MEVETIKFIQTIEAYNQFSRLIGATHFLMECVRFGAFNDALLEICNLQGVDPAEVQTALEALYDALFPSHDAPEQDIEPST